MNPKKMQRMMKQLGINIQELDDVDEIIIRTSDKEYVFNDDVAVTIMISQGQKTYQIVGNPSVRERGSEPIHKAKEDAEPEAEEEEKELEIPQEDIELICQQTGVSEEEARAALEACDGNPAEAILKLMQE
jgi:nascent polypeptide-associated complex subunit alpha